jgi:hypothetical protein
MDRLTVLEIEERIYEIMRIKNKLKRYSIRKKTRPDTWDHVEEKIMFTLLVKLQSELDKLKIFADSVIKDHGDILDAKNL